MWMLRERGGVCLGLTRVLVMMLVMMLVLMLVLVLAWCKLGSFMLAAADRPQPTPENSVRFTKQAHSQPGYLTHTTTHSQPTHKTTHQQHIQPTRRMAPPLFLHDHREAGCFAVHPDREFYRVGNLFIKRTMRQHEWQKMSRTWVVTPSASLPQRYRNDVAIQRYLRARTNIPLPAFAQTFEDDGAMYLVAEFVEGVGMNELPEEDRRVVQKELQQHIETLKALRFDTPGLPGISDD